MATENGIFADHRLLERRHNEFLLPMLEAVCDAADISPQALDVVGFSAGPGSFTGVRIAAAAVQAVSFVAEAQVVPVSSSRVLMLSAQNVLEEGEVGVCSIRSRGDAYYLSAYVDNELLYADELCTESPAWLHSDMTLIGESPGWLEGGLTLMEVEPDARAMLHLVAQLHAQGESVTPESALPRYLEGDSPWKKSVTASSSSP